MPGTAKDSETQVKLRVLLLSRYGQLGPSSRIRSYQYLPYLAKRGIKVLGSPLLSDEYVRTLFGGGSLPHGQILAAYVARVREVIRRRNSDLIWIEKDAFPWLPTLLEELVLRSVEIPFIIDFDDAVFHRYDQHKFWAVRRLLGKKLDHLMQTAATVIVGNRYLEQRARTAGARRIEYLPSVVDMARFPERISWPNGVFTVGWIGTPDTCKFLHLVAEPLKDFCAAAPARLLVIGACVSIPGVPVECRPWAEASEADDLHAADVGIMPLTDGSFERGKCGYKLTQYMAAGLPAIASPVGANSTIIRPMENGLLAASNAEWFNALALLRANPGLARAMGRRGRQIADEHYSLSHTAPQLAHIIERAVAKVCDR